MGIVGIFLGFVAAKAYLDVREMKSGLLQASSHSTKTQTDAKFFDSAMLL